MSTHIDRACNAVIMCLLAWLVHLHWTVTHFVHKIKQRFCNFVNNAHSIHLINKTHEFSLRRQVLINMQHMHHPIFVGIAYSGFARWNYKSSALFNNVKIKKLIIFLLHKSFVMYETWFLLILKLMFIRLIHIGVSFTLWKSCLVSHTVVWAPNER